ALAGETGQTTEFEAGKSHRILYAPLILDEEIVGVYSVEIVGTAIRTLQQQLMTQTWLVLLGTGLLMIGLIYILMRHFIISPLVALEKATQDIGAGQLTAPLPPAGNDEIGKLTASFGTMVDQLQTLLDKQEQRIQERTADLAKANKDLQHAKELAEAANLTKDQFLAVVSHELRTPLGAIIGYIELLDNGLYGPTTDRQKEVLERVLVNGDRLIELVSSLLHQAKLDSGQVALNIVPFEPQALISYIDSSLRLKARDKGLTLHQKLDPALPARLKGDIDRLQDILGNLVGNAIKFTETGSVAIEIKQVNCEQWALQVADTGPGISAEDQRHIFAPFQQVDSSATRAYTGIGLGLSIVKSLTTLMGGTVTLDSKLGQGSTFTVILPLEALEE
ncbi:MAG: ATP-binding protein, partial [Chloroflexota bacterium]